MHLPFTKEEFLNVFKLYNQSVFPLQILFYIIALFIVYITFRKSKNSSKIISLCLSMFWLWIGLVYHINYFTRINKAAYLFGILFILQGIIFFIYGAISGKLQFAYNKSFYNYTGIIFILYALILYPVIGYLSGHQYPYSPTFGLPCPTTIFTFGMFLFVDKKISPAILIIPFLWSILGVSAALQLSIYEDIGLLLSGLIGISFLIVRNRKIKQQVIEPSLKEI